MLPRAIRNNNPLNIRRSKDKWKGLRAQQTDAAFCQFESMEYGWRAAFWLLTRTYYHTYRLFTIKAIQETGTTALDYFAMLRGWDWSRQH